MRTLKTKNGFFLIEYSTIYKFYLQKGRAKLIYSFKFPNTYHFDKESNTFIEDISEIYFALNFQSSIEKFIDQSKTQRINDQVSSSDINNFERFIYIDKGKESIENVVSIYVSEETSSVYFFLKIYQSHYKNIYNSNEIKMNTLSENNNFSLKALIQKEKYLPLHSFKTRSDFKTTSPSKKYVLLKFGKDTNLWEYQLIGSHFDLSIQNIGNSTITFGFTINKCLFKTLENIDWFDSQLKNTKNIEKNTFQLSRANVYIPCNFKMAGKATKITSEEIQTPIRKSLYFKNKLKPERISYFVRTHFFFLKRNMASITLLSEETSLPLDN